MIFLKRKTFYRALKRPFQWGRVKLGNIELDPRNTFNLLMDYSEKYNIGSTFNFIPINSNKIMDASYSLENDSS